MPRPSAFRRTALAVALLLATSCVSTQLPPISRQGEAFSPLRDERMLWMQSRDEEKELLDHVELYEDPGLEEYLDRIVDRLTPPGMAANREIHYRVRVIEDPALNAFAYPHGSIYVHTGLLARMENEDQVATVLGHEMTHVENRHMLRFQRSAHNKQVGLSIAAIAAEVAIAVAEGNAYDHGDWGKGAVIDVLGQVLVNLGLQLAFLASVNGYGRELELEADEGGMAKVAAAGYDVGESPKVYQALLDDHGEPKKLEGFFFGSHPRLTERIENARGYLKTHPQARDRYAEHPAGDRDAFALRMRPVVRDDARQNLEKGRLVLAQTEVARALAAAPRDPEAHYLDARLKLAQAEAEKSPAAAGALRGDARQALQESLQLDPKRPAPHRDLGLLLAHDRELTRACAEFKRYLDLAPEAADAAEVRTQVRDLDRDGHCR